MGSHHLLAGLARRLNSDAGAPRVPSLFFFTDPKRTPDPIAVARKLPRGAAVVYRHFGAADRGRIAQRLGAVCRARGLLLLISADPGLARRARAAGVHWPEARLPEATRDTAGLVTASAHSAEALARAAAFGADACVLGPVFPTRSDSGRALLGLFHASQLARASALPVIALGGVSKANAHRLAGRGFAGLAGVEAFVDA